MARISKEAKAFISKQISENFSHEQLGLGIEIVGIDRMRRICERTKSFVPKMFSPQEIRYCNRYADPIAHFATLFAAKLAVLTALELKFSDGVGYRDIEVDAQSSSKPQVRLYNLALQVSNEREVASIPISLSHTQTEAICCVLAITKSSAEQIRDKANGIDELTARFRETRRMLDEI